jgi:L,D-transpeptidase YcfS
LGEYALRLRHGNGEYLIHGTNKDFGIGLRVSSGCIRMEPTNIEWLFQQVRWGTRVQIVNQPIKMTIEPDNSVYIESHEPLTASSGFKQSFEWPQQLQDWLMDSKGFSSKVNSVVQVQSGLPTLVMDGS